MAFLTSPNLAYVLVVVGLTLIFLATINNRTMLLNLGALLCFIATVLAFFYLRINPWAFVAVALSPFAYARAVRQASSQKLLLILSIFILAIGPFFLFVDQDNMPLVSNRWAWVSVLSATIVWISFERLRNVKGVRMSEAGDSVIGMIGETITDIEPHSAGSVIVEGDMWQARSKEFIPAGSTVRVLRQDGFWLTVKQEKKLPQK